MSTFIVNILAHPLAMMVAIIAIFYTLELGHWLTVATENDIIDGKLPADTQLFRNWQSALIWPIMAIQGFIALAGFVGSAYYLNEVLTHLNSTEHSRLFGTVGRMDKISFVLCSILLGMLVMYAGKLAFEVSERTGSRYPLYFAAINGRREDVANMRNGYMTTLPEMDPRRALLMAKITTMGIEQHYAAQQDAAFKQG